MKTLTWLQGHCTNAPKGWVLTLMRCEAEWTWYAYQGNEDSDHYVKSLVWHAKEEEAERDCEATLWLLGVLPLPEWTTDDEEATPPWPHLQAAGFSVTVEMPSGMWHIEKGPVNVRGTGGATLAQTVLRTLIARAIKEVP